MHAQFRPLLRTPLLPLWVSLLCTHNLVISRASCRRTDGDVCRQHTSAYEELLAGAYRPRDMYIPHNCFLLTDIDRYRPCLDMLALCPAKLERLKKKATYAAACLETRLKKKIKKKERYAAACLDTPLLD
jgi:hypothetical protein